MFDEHQPTTATRSWQPSRSEAARLLLNRRSARTSLIGFTEQTNSRYETAPFHRQVAAKLEAVERGDIDRLMLMLPPRHGKSELASRRFPAFALGRDPARQFISVSATAELASDFGRDVRNVIAGQEYRTLFETTLADDSQARNKWHTDAGGIFYAIGIDGTVLGRGADIMLIDDPFATMADAQSDLQRKRVWDWYMGTAYNRLMPGGAIVVIGHRMHEDDLQGRLLAQQAAGGDHWEVLELPAISADGGALWPERYDLAALERIKANTLSRFWSALYQQEPTPDTGDYFRVEWLKPIAPSLIPEPRFLRVYGASDYAVTAKGGDYTVHAVVGLDADDRLFLLDLWRGQTDSAEWIDAWCDLVRLWKPIEWAEEGGQINASVGPFLERTALERKAYTVRRQFPSRHDKAVRAQSIRGRMAMRGLYVPADASWRGAFAAELLRFPAATHDDQVDALSLVGQLLDTMQLGVRPKPAARPEPHDAYKPPKPHQDDTWFSTL